MDRWNKAGGAANVGLFILTAISTVFLIWDRMRPQTGQSPAPQGVATVANSWAIPIVLCAALLVAAGLQVFAAYVSRGKKSTSVNLSVGSSGGKCPDTWLHKIALDQAETIYRFVHVTRLVIAQNELFGRSDPYMEIQVGIDNRSLYEISVDNPFGHIYFQQREISGPLTWAERTIPTHGNDGVVTLKQSLDGYDVVHILNGSSEEAFDFNRLELRVKGAGSSEPLVKSQPLSLRHRMTNAPLIQKYPKLDIVVLSMASTFVCNFQTWGVSADGTPEDGYITLEVSLKNFRTIDAQIESFRIEVSLRGKPCVAQAETGNALWEKTNISDSGNVSHSGKQFKNLAGVLPLSVNQSGASGHLQFFFREVGASPMLDAIPYELVMTDKSGERHSFEGVIPKHEG